jgi:Uma2 family endonuclease
MAEMEQFTLPGQLRRYDLAYVTRADIATGNESVAEFVLEIISPTDNYIKVGKKLREYFQAGVKVVWHINPEEELIYVYTSPTQVAICESHTVCSAAPVLDDFRMEAWEVFKKV